MSIYEDCVGRIVHADESVLKAARERYPALFKRTLTGVRPMEGGAGEMDEMPLKERMRMANEDPEGYMRMFW